MSKFKIGDIVRHQMEDERWNWRVDKVNNGEFPTVNVSLACSLNEHYQHGYSTIYMTSVLKLVRPASKKRTKQTRVKKLYMASVKDGATHKGLVNVVNKRGARSFGETPTQAISRYEDNHGGKIKPDDEILVWKLEPYTVRKQGNGKFRLNRKVE